ncbi:MAG: hypothetical protein ACLP6G_22975 [Terriglobales bacterium]
MRLNLPGGDLVGNGFGENVDASHGYASVWQMGEEKQSGDGNFKAHPSEL